MINSNAADLMRAASHHRVKMNVSYYRDRLLPIRGELLSYHKLLQQSGSETMLCWATHGECDKRCAGLATAAAASRRSTSLALDPLLNTSKSNG